MNQSGPVALVTGAAGGIGAATVTRLRDDGFVVAGFDVRPGDGVEMLDVTDAASVESAVASVIAAHGRLDLVANVAGISQFGRVEGLTDDEWHRNLAVNLTGPFTVIRAALPHLRAARGCVVNVASIAGVHGQAYTAAYSAAKGGLVMLTKALAVELAPDGVRVNCVCPAGVDTPLVAEVAGKIPPDADRALMARMNMLLPGLVSPEEVAGAIAYLASDDARNVTGHALVLDGGRSA